MTISLSLVVTIVITMDKIKERMRQLKESIEQAEQREVDAKCKTKEVDAKFDKSGGDKTTLESRINVVRAELVKVRERLAEGNEKLEDALERSERSEVRRKQLAETEVDDFEYTEEVSSAVKTAGTARESGELLVAEAERKVVVLEADLARTDEKRTKFATRVEKLNAEIVDVRDEIRALKEKDIDASEREDESEDKAKFLEAQVRQVIARVDEKERDAVKLKREHGDVELKIESWQKKLKQVKEQKEEIGDIDDD